jgi:hypothetical protein
MCALRLHVTLGETVISDLKRAVCKQKRYNKSDTRASGNPMAFNNMKAYFSSWPDSIGLPKKRLAQLIHSYSNFITSARINVLLEPALVASEAWWCKVHLRLGLLLPSLRVFESYFHRELIPKPVRIVKQNEADVLVADRSNVFRVPVHRAAKITAFASEIVSL